MKIKHWEVTSSKIVHSTPWINIIEDECLIDGKLLTYTYTKRIDEGPMIIAEEEDRALWMVQEYRHPIKKIIWQFPNEGKLENESWYDAAVRGLEEELQLKAAILKDLGSFYPDPGGLDQKYYLYLAQGLTKIANNKHVHTEDEGEFLNIQKFTRIEIDQMIVSKEICDNWTLAGLFLYDQYKKRVK